jgi:DNA-binding PadR family transcriptional regulator
MEALLLACLEREPAHGYRIIELLRERSDGVFTLAEGTIYPALRRLEAGALVASAWQDAGGRRRRVYRLTPAGTAALRQRQAEWRAFSGAVDQVLLTGAT